MQIAKQLAGFYPAEAETLRRAIGKKIHELMASLKPKFLDGCAANGVTPGGRRPALEGHGVLAGLLVQQGALGVLRAHRVPHRVAQGEPPVRVHGGAHLERHEHEGPRPDLRQRLRRDGDRGAAARRQLVGRRLRGRRGQDPLRAERGEERGGDGRAPDRRGARRGRSVRVDLGLHRARRPAGRQQALARVARQVRRPRLDRAPRGWGCSPCSSRRSRTARSSRRTGSWASRRSSTACSTRPRAPSSRTTRRSRPRSSRSRSSCGSRRRRSASTSPSTRSRASATSFAARPTRRSPSSSGGATARSSRSAASSPTSSS